MLGCVANNSSFVAHSWTMSNQHHQRHPHSTELPFISCTALQETPR